MANRDLVVFDIFADYAHFKRPYTTTSPVTWPVPSKPTLYGMMAAIAGLDKESYLDHFYNRDVLVGIRIKNPIHKCYIAENLINTKEGMAKIKNRTQIKIEFLKHVAYRIYVYHPLEEISRTLIQNLEAHKSHYTFSMGLSECIANFAWVGIYPSLSRSQQDSGDFQEIHSVIPVAALGDTDPVIRFDPGKEIFRVALTAEMNGEREIQQMIDIIYERSGSTIAARVRNWQEIPGLGEQILLF
jgi:CRISPR-associated protein Cas5h